MIDAVRLNDQSLVYIKVVRGDSEEVQIAKYLRSEELQKDPRNCCVPILDVLHLPGDEDLSFMVMPFLRYIDSPPFELVGDVLQCGGELLKVRTAAPYISATLKLTRRSPGTGIPARTQHSAPVRVQNNFTTAII